MNSLEVKNIFEIINTLKYFNEYLVQKKKFFQMEYIEWKISSFKWSMQQWKIYKIKYKKKNWKKKSAELTCGTILNCSNTFVIKDPEELIGEHKW